MNFAAVFLRALAEPVQIAVIVVLGEKAGLSIVPALNDVQRQIRQVEAGRRGMGLGDRAFSQAGWLCKTMRLPPGDYDLVIS